jgi:PadR family transcriptional regulator PadR
MRVTQSLVSVAIALLENPTERHWGYPLTRAARVPSGVLYPILGRMLEEGWLSDGWEDINPSEKKRPPRRYYEITPLGLSELASTVRHAAASGVTKSRRVAPA